MENSGQIRTLTILPTAISAGDWSIARVKEGAVFGTGALSHSQFVRMAHRSVHPTETWLAEGESLALLASVVDRYYSDRPAAPFAGLRRRAGFWQSLHRFLSECRKAGLGPGELKAVLEVGVGPDRAGLLDDLYGAYVQRLRDLRATDAAGAEAKLAESIRESADRIPVLADVDEIEIRGIYDIKPVTFEWILELARRRPTTVFLPLPKDHPRSIRWLEWTYRKFEYLGEESPPGLTIQSEDLQTGRALSDLLPRLFHPLAQLKEQQVEPLPSNLPIRVLEAGDPRKEVLEIARRVKELWRTGANLSRIAVLFRRPDVYSNTPDAFAAFGIPIEVSRELRSEWDPDPLIREALDLASLAADGFDREDLLGWIGRTRCPLPEALNDPDLGRILREARILRGDPASLRDRLTAYAGRVKDKSLGERVKSILAALTGVLGPADRLAEPGEPRRYIRHLRDSLESIGLGRPGFEIESADPAKLHEKFTRLERILENWEADLEPTTLFDLLAASLSGEALTEGGGGVRLLSVHDIAGIEIDHLFIAGLTAGAFPEEPKQEVFLKDRERQEISAAFTKNHRDRLGPRLAGHRPFDTAREERLRENFMFFLCLAQPAAGVTLSYPKLDNQGRPTTPSPYLDEIYKQFADPAALLLRGGEGPPTSEEMEIEAVLAVERRQTPVGVPDPDRFRRIAGRIDIERRRDQFYLERRREVRSTLAFEHTGRLRSSGPFWKKEEMTVKALEAFAGCPYKGFAGELLGVREIDRPVEGLSGKDMGTLMHKFLEIFWTELKKKYETSAREVDPILEDARRIAPAALDEAARQMAALGAAGPLWESQRKALNHLIDSMIDREKEALRAGYWPQRLEHPVSMDLQSPPGTHPRKLVGRLDRLDRGADGSLRIIDYKTADISSLRDKKKKIGLTELQLPAYAAAVLAAEKQPAAGWVALLYFSLRHAAQTIEVWSGEAGELSAVFDPAKILDGIHHGRFDVTPEDVTLCQTCDFRKACRVREVLTAAKPAEEP